MYEGVYEKSLRHHWKRRPICERRHCQSECLWPLERPRKRMMRRWALRPCWRFVSREALGAARRAHARRAQGGNSCHTLRGGEEEGERTRGMTIANRWKTEGKGTEENRRKRKLEHKGLG